MEPLAKELGLDYISFACKPLTVGISRALHRMRLPRQSVALVGDQIFTDIIGGNLRRVKTVLVEPFHLENKKSFKLKRTLESVVFKRDYSRLERK